MRATEHTANAALHAAAQRVEREQAHMEAWAAPSTCSRPTARSWRACDAVLLVLLVLVLAALVLGVL